MTAMNLCTQCHGRPYAPTSRTVGNASINYVRKGLLITSEKPESIRQVCFSQTKKKGPNKLCIKRLHIFSNKRIKFNTIHLVQSQKVSINAYQSARHGVAHIKSQHLEVEAGRSHTQGQAWLHSKTLFQRKKNILSVNIIQFSSIKQLKIYINNEGILVKCYL